VIPRDANDVVAALAVCRDYDAPVLARGAGTSLAGQTCDETVLLDFSKYMNQIEIVEIYRERRRALAQPGLILYHLRRETEAGSPPLTFGPDPATHDHCMLGGMIGNNSSGVHSVMSAFYGPGPRTSDNVVSLDVLTYDWLRFEVGPTSDDELAQPSRIGGRRGEIFCCGMAGAFGFERGDHYAVSIAVGERVLLPAVRAADAQTPILADGFSCREQQIRQQTDRQPLHLAEVPQHALPGGGAGRV